MNKRILKTMLIVAGGGMALSQLAFTQMAEAQKAGLNNTCTNAFNATSWLETCFNGTNYALPALTITSTPGTYNGAGEFNGVHGNMCVAQATCYNDDHHTCDHYDGHQACNAVAYAWFEPYAIKYGGPYFSNCGGQLEGFIQGGCGAPPYAPAKPVASPGSTLLANFTPDSNVSQKKPEKLDTRANPKQVRKTK